MTDDPLQLVALLGAEQEPTPRGEDIAHGRLLDRIHGLAERRPAARPRAAALAGALVVLAALLVLGGAGRSPSGAASAEAARKVVRELPYPPGRADSAQVVLRTAQAGDGRSVLEQAQYRAWCKWLAYWLERRAAGDDGGARVASEVLAASSQWTGLRAGREPARAAATAAGRGDVRSAQLLATARCPTSI